MVHHSSVDCRPASTRSTVARQLAALACPLIVAIAAMAQAHAAESVRDRTDQLVQPYIAHDIVVGMTVGVLQQGEETILGYGRVGDEGSGVPDGDTIYEIGSTSKVFTGLLLADAVVSGRVRLNQPAAQLLPDHVRMPSYSDEPVSLQALATHVSGLPRLPDNLGSPDPLNPYADYSINDLYEFLSGHKLTRRPGEETEYSNLAQGLLGHLLALDQGMSYEQLVHDRIAAPLNMSSTAITLNEQQRRRLATPHTADGRATSSWDIPTLAGAGAIRSSVRDLLRFMAAHLTPPTGQLGQAIDKAWAIHQQPLADGEFARGLGWHVAHDGRTRWHNGQTGGYHAMLLINRDLQAAVVVLANTATAEVDRLAQDIVLVLAGASVEPREFAEPVEVPRDVMRRYAGKYQLAPGFIFTVTVDDVKLMVGLTGQPTFQVHARSDTEWFYRVVDATLTFQLNEQGECKSVELFQHGVRQTAQRIE